MSSRKAREAGNGERRGTVIKAICWRQRMQLGAGSRPGDSRGHTEPHEPPGPGRGVKSEQ